ncbi:MAG: rRNA maturation RNase YbeY [Clostridium sp.]|jgi:probable rRNA maturation factor|nr:rRNA maturation RNase YbeY [Clostridium sp.]
MTFYVEEDTEQGFAFPVEETVRSVALETLEQEGCPYEAQVNVLLVDDGRIREWNRRYRGIDRETDVLSFPNLEFEEPGKFLVGREQEADCFDPDTGELLLGDIVLSADRVKEQAAAYGHSEKRELAFLVAHSMLHLCGYDHTGEEDTKAMEERQERILGKLGLPRTEPTLPPDG